MITPKMAKSIFDLTIQILVIYFPKIFVLDYFQLVMTRLKFNGNNCPQNPDP